MWSDCRAGRRALSVLVNELVKPPGFPWISSLSLLSRDAATSKPWPMHPCKPQRHHDLFFVWNVLPSTHISAHPSIHGALASRPFSFKRGFHYPSARAPIRSSIHPRPTAFCGRTCYRPAICPSVHSRATGFWVVFFSTFYHPSMQRSIYSSTHTLPVSGSFLKTVLPPIRPSF